MEAGVRISLGLVLLLPVLAAAPATAGGGGGAPENEVAGENRVACGQWVLKTRNFGKLKIRDYNKAWVPERFQTTSPLPAFTIFNFIDDTQFVMGLIYPDQQGMNVVQLAPGTYRQRGKKLTFRLDPGGLDGLEAAFSDFLENKVFGSRERIVEVTFGEINPGSVKFKGRSTKNGRFKAKMKARLRYDIRTDAGSELPDYFDAKGTLKMRMWTTACP